MTTETMTPDLIPAWRAATAACIEDGAYVAPVTPGQWAAALAAAFAAHAAHGELQAATAWQTRTVSVVTGEVVESWRGCSQKDFDKTGGAPYVWEDVLRIEFRALYERPQHAAVTSLTDTEIDARLNDLHRGMRERGEHNGGMSGVAWDRAVFRAALTAALRPDGDGGNG